MISNKNTCVVSSTVYVWRVQYSLGSGEAADFLHGGATRFGVEQAHVQRQMCSVVVRQTIGLRRAVEDRRDAGGRHDSPWPLGPFGP